jgi:hypothetical protein
MKIDYQKNPIKAYLFLAATFAVLFSIIEYTAERIGFMDKTSLPHFLFQIVFTSLLWPWFFLYVTKRQQKRKARKAAAPSEDEHTLP